MLSDEAVCHAFPAMCLLQAMKEAETGLYCGPLRLLAMEVFDSVNQEVGPLAYQTRMLLATSISYPCYIVRCQ